MSFKTTIALLVILVAGAAVAYFLPQGPSARDDEIKTAETDKSKYVFDPQPDDKTIVRATWERKDKPRVVFERAPKKDSPEQMDDWRIVEPIKAATESYAVDNWMKTFLSAQTRGGFEPGKSGEVATDATGLNAPVATVTLAAKDGKEYKLEVGKKPAMSDDTYARIAGQTSVHRVKADLTRELTKELKEFRSKQLFRLVAENAKKLDIDYEGRHYDFTKSDNGDWVINEPVKAHGNKDKILALIRAVNALYVEDFISDAPENLEKYGLSSPALKIAVVTEAKKTLPADKSEPASQPAEPKVEITSQTFALEVGSFSDMKEQKRFIKPSDQNWVAAIANSNVTNITPKLSELRDAHITRVRAADGTELDIANDGQTAAIKKVGDSWTGTGDLTELDKAAVADVVEAFEDLKAISFIDTPEDLAKSGQDLAKIGLEPAQTSVKVTAAGAIAPVTLKLGGHTASGRNTYVQVDGQPTVYVVDAEQAKRLAVSPISLRSRTVFAAEGGQIRKLDITRGNVHYVLNREGAAWKMAEPGDAAHDVAGVNDILRDLPNLRARRVVAKGDFEKYGLANPVVSMKFTVEKPTQPAASQPDAVAAPPGEMVEHTLFAGRQGNVPYCRIDDNPYVFELDETIFRVLAAELIDRKLFAFNEKDVTGVTVQTPMFTLPLEKDQDKWVYKPDQFVELSQKKVKDFITDLAGFKVEEYIAYSGGDLAAAGLADARASMTIAIQNQPPIVLKIEPDRPGGLPRRVAWLEKNRIFTLRAADAEKLVRTLDYYVKPEKEEKTPAKPPTDFPEPGPDDGN